jgi:hypothetical protein
MDELKILIIDNNKYYWDTVNECLIPYESINNKNDSNDYLNHSLNLYNKTVQENNNNNDNNNNNNNNNNNDNNNNDCLEWYMENYDIDFWENILSRRLDTNEKRIFHGIWNENLLNIDIKMLQKNIIGNFCYIKSITNNVGNCLFESLGSLGLGDNDMGIKPCNMIRKNLAALLLAVKTEVGFFPNLPNLTLEEIFLNQNEIELIKDSKTKTIYLYDYDMMVYDLNSKYSWERLPTEFLLMVISRIYQVEILIYHNKTKYINKINVWNNSENLNTIEKIRLGQINEEHYFPLIELDDELKHNTDVLNEIINTDIKYDNHLKKFKKWSKIMIESINQNKFNQIPKIMKTTNNLSQERMDDYNQISNFKDFKYI